MVGELGIIQGLGFIWITQPQNEIKQHRRNNVNQQRKIVHSVYLQLCYIMWRMLYMYQGAFIEVYKRISTVKVNASEIMSS